MEKRVQRLISYMGLRSLSEAQVTKQCGLSNGLIGNAKRGKCDLGDKAVEKILSTYNELNPSWLREGYGPMLKTTAIIQENNESAVGQNFGTINSHHGTTVDANHYVPRAAYDDLMDKCHQLERRVHELTDEIISLTRQLLQNKQL